MAGQPNGSKLSKLAGSEGDLFDPSELEFGEVDESLPDDEEVLASAEDGENERELDPAEEESTDGDEPAEEEGEVEYEEDDEGGDEAPAPAAPAPAQAPLAAPAAVAQPAPSAPAAAAPQKVLHELLLEHEDKLVDQLAKSTFKLTGKDAEMFDDDTVRHFIASNNAKVFVKTMASVSQWLHAALPAAVENLTRVNSDVDRHESAFLAEHKDLNVPGIREKLGEVARFVRSQQPNLNRAQLAAETARYTRALHNLPQPAAKKPGAPAGNQKPKVKTVSRMPFRPAGSGAPRTDNGAKPKKDPLQALNDMLMQDFD